MIKSQRTLKNFKNYGLSILAVFVLLLIAREARSGANITGTSGGGVSTGTTRIIAGSGIGISPSNGAGEVTITNLIGAVGSAGNNIASSTQAWMNGGQTNSFQINSVTGAYQTSAAFFISSLTVTGTLTSTTPISAPVPAARVQSGAFGTSVMISSIAANVVSSNTIVDGTIGLTDLQSSIVLSSDTTGVTPGTYSNATVTVDRNGRVWAASVGSVSGSTYTGTFSGSGATFSTLSVTGSGSLSVTGGVATLNILGGGSGVSPLELFQDGVGRSSPTASIKIGSNLTLTLNGSSPTLSATGGSGVSDNLGNHVATMPIVSPYALTVASGTVYGRLSVGSITVVSAGAPVINSTHAVIQVKVTDLSDTDFEVAEASVSVNGVRVSTYQPDTVATLTGKTFDATLASNLFTSSRTFATWAAVAYTSLTVINRSSSKTVGMSEYQNAVSSEANCAYGKAIQWPIGMNGDPTGSLMVRGGGTGSHRYVVGYSTIPTNVDVQFSTPTGGVNFDFAADAGGTSEGARILTNTTMTAWSSIPPGAFVEPVVCRDGDAAADGSGTNSFGFELVLIGKFDQ